MTMMVHLPQAEKQTYGCQCHACGEIWDCYQVPAPAEVSIRAMNANMTCWKCGSDHTFIYMPWRYEQMKAERRGAEAPPAAEGIWQPEYKGGLVAALVEMESKLPGWWWTVGSCALTAHASVGPDRTGPDAHLLEVKQFDEGFHADLPRPSTCSQALFQCIEKALSAKKLMEAEGEAA